MSLQKFANPSVVVQDWYVACPSKQLANNQIYGFELAHRKLIVYRDIDGHAHVLDARCPHLGADLSMGKVLGKNVQCPFHNWELGADGRVVCAPRWETLPSRRVGHYQTIEKWGLIWFFNGQDVTHELPEIDAMLEKRYYRFPAQILNAHPHLVLGNGLDVAHMQPLHGLQLLKEPQWQASGNVIKNSFSAQFTSPVRRWLTGSQSSVIEAGFSTYGSAIAFAEIRQPFYGLTLFTGRPDSQGRCHTQTVMFFQTRRPSYLVKAVLSIFFLLKDDRKLLDGLDFHPSFTPEDRYLHSYAKLIEGMNCY